MKFPRFTKKEDDRCKLLDEDIVEIQKRREGGETYKSISKDYDISPQAIYYWCLDDKVRKERIKRRDRSGQINDKNYQKRYRKKRMRLHPETRTYEIKNGLRWRANNPERYKKALKIWSKKYYLKNKEKRNAYNREYQKENLEKFRIYNKKHRDKNREEINRRERERYYKRKQISRQNKHIKELAYEPKIYTNSNNMSIRQGTKQPR